MLNENDIQQWWNRGASFLKHLKSEKQNHAFFSAKCCGVFSFEAPSVTTRAIIVLKRRKNPGSTPDQEVLFSSTENDGLASQKPSCSRVPKSKDEATSSRQPNATKREKSCL